jgi:hypothetical protein
MLKPILWIQLLFKTIIQGGILVTVIFIAKTTADIKKNTSGGNDPNHQNPTGLKAVINKVIKSPEIPGSVMQHILL